MRTAYLDGMISQFWNSVAILALMRRERMHHLS
jgi:hypothetical protein